MKSLSQKIVLLIFISILVSTFLVASTSIVIFNRSMNEAAHEILSISCNESKQEINNILSRIEQSTDVLTEYAKTNFARAKMRTTTDPTREEYISDATRLGFSIIEKTAGAVSCFLRLDPAITGEYTSGFMITKDKAGRLSEIETTDLSLYSEEDHYVSWFYGPKNSGTAMWLNPYYYKNIEVQIITYVSPIYVDGTFVGVAGMDIDFGHITNIVDDVHIYETGYAFLTDKNLAIIHSKHDFAKNLRPGGDNTLTFDDVKNSASVWQFKDDGKKMGITFSELDNGMCLAVTISQAESHKNVTGLIIQTVLILIITAVVFFFITAHFAADLIKPLKRLNEISTEVARGNLDVYFEHSSNDEIGTLAKNTMLMVKQIRKRINYTDTLAYTDNMTGLKNYTAYKRDLEEISKSILQGNVHGVFVVDINGLKSINDTHGHRHGNELIVCSAKIVANTFGYENVYRIGGDEFVAILQNTGHDECARYLEIMRTKLAKPHGSINCSLAIGFAISEGDKPITYDALFEEADKSMYFDKLQKKSRGETSSFAD